MMGVVASAVSTDTAEGGLTRMRAGSGRPNTRTTRPIVALAATVLATILATTITPAAAHHVGSYVPRDNAITTNFKQIKFSVQAKRFDVALQLFEQGAVRAEMRAQAATLPPGLEDGTRAALRASDGLETERRRMGNTALHSLDGSRMGDELVKSLRSQLRPSADHLLQSIRRLMDSTVESGQKKLVESVLEDARRIHAGLQERDLQAESAS